MLSLFKTKFWRWSLLCGIILAFISLMPQIILWGERGTDWNGTYAITDMDEPFYGAYLNSLLDGKPRLNSPYSGAEDSVETPQYESQLSIQFLAVYPLALVGKALNLSSSATFILATVLVAFLTGSCLFWLICQFFDDHSSAFFVSLIIILGGGMAGGQGMTFSAISGRETHYLQSLIFMRQFLPAMAMPALFLFPALIWKYLNSETYNEKFKWGGLASLTFASAVFTYFYTWTVLLAWAGTLFLLWTAFRFADVKKHFALHFGLFLTLLLGFIPYFLLVQNRAVSSDSVVILDKTHSPDLFRLPQIISYFTLALFIFFWQSGWINLKERAILFLLSFNLVIPVLFNQQVLTGLSMQPYHYEFFSGNYFVLISLIPLIFILIKAKFEDKNYNRILLYAAALSIGIALFDSGFSALWWRETNAWRDKFKPAADRLKLKVQAENLDSALILSFDLSDIRYFNGNDLPMLTGQPVLWSPYLIGQPDMGFAGSKERLKPFLYYQNVKPETLRGWLLTREKLIALGCFPGDRHSTIYTGKMNPITNEEINEIVKDYQKFVENFDEKAAGSLPISFVLINNSVENDFSNLDLWYQRDAGETVGDYTIYRVKLRQESK